MYGKRQIFKKEDKADPSNYRPISMTCVLCKVLEHIVASYLFKYVTTEIIYELQHGFRKRRSCDTKLIMLVDESSKAMQMGKQTDLILLDFNKTFDNLPMKTHPKSCITMVSEEIL